MSVCCDRCSERSHNLEDYENFGSDCILCHACANEVRIEQR